MRGVILAGGVGSRLSPLTTVTSKHLLPIFDKPMIYYPLSVLMLAGIREIAVIVNPDQRDNYYRALGDGSRFGIELVYVEQHDADGIPGAILLTKRLFEGETICVILGDNLFIGKDFYISIKEHESIKNGACAFVCRVKNPQRFGVIEIEGNNVVSIEEKPQFPKSNLAITGLYVFDKHIYSICDSLKKSERGEYEITDVLINYADRQSLTVQHFGRGTSWFDAGLPQSILEASNLVSIIQNRQDTQIACLEEIALTNSWISPTDITKKLDYGGGSSYDKHLQTLFKNLE